MNGKYLQTHAVQKRQAAITAYSPAELMLQHFADVQRGVAPSPDVVAICHAACERAAWVLRFLGLRALQSI